MLGSLESPPIVIYKSRWKSFGLFVVSVALTCGAVLEVINNNATALTYVCLGLFGPGGLIFAWYIFKPAKLVIGPDGILLRELTCKRSLNWNDVQNFRAQYMTQYRGSQMVAYDIIGGPLQKGARFARMLRGADATLPGGWTLGPRKLADLLNAADDRWSSDKK